MQVFNESKYPKPSVVVVLDEKEVQALLDMSKIACDVNKRKKLWKKMREDLMEKAECF